MVSLRNEVRKKRRAGHTTPVPSLSFQGPETGNNSVQRDGNDFPVRVSSGAERGLESENRACISGDGGENEGRKLFVPEVEEARVSAEVDDCENNVDKARISTEGEKREKSAGKARVSTEVEKREKGAGKARVSTEGEKRENSGGKARVSTEGDKCENSAGKSKVSTESDKCENSAGKSKVSKEGDKCENSAGKSKVSKEGDKCENSTGKARVSTEGGQCENSAGKAGISKEGDKFENNAGKSRVSTEGNKCENSAGKSRVSTEGNKCENSAGNSRVSTEGNDCENSAGKGLDGGEMRHPGVPLPELQSSCSGADDDEDNIPIGKILFWNKKGEGQKRKSLNETHNGNNPVKNGNISFKSDASGKDDVPDRGKRVKIEQSDKELDEDEDLSERIINLIPGRVKNVKVERKVAESKFQEGDMVWAKVKSHPWWPGQVYNPIFASATARRNKKPGHLLIAFFGDSSYGWFLECDLVPFEENHVEKSRQSTSRGFAKAVEEAMDEIRRRAALGLMCFCKNGGSFQPRKQEGYVSVNVEGYVAPGLYSWGQIEAAKKSFMGADVVSFVRRLAMAPASGEDRSIPGIKSVAEACAYRAARYSSVDEDYREALRIGESISNDGIDGWDQCLPEPEVVCRDFSSEPAVVDEQNETPKHAKVNDLARKSISLQKTSEKEDRYVLKRRDGVNTCSSIGSDDCLMNYLIQADFLQKTGTDSEVKDEEGQDAGGIGRYVFKKRIQHEESKSIERNEDGQRKKKRVPKEGGDFREAQARKKEVVRKAFHMRPLNIQKESDNSALLRQTSDGDGMSETFNSEGGMLNEISPVSGGIQESNDLSSVNHCVGSHTPPADARQRLPRGSGKKNEKKPAAIGKQFSCNVISGKMLENESKFIGFDESSQEEQRMGPTTMHIDEINHAGNDIEERSGPSGREFPENSELRDTESINAPDELHRMQTSSMDVDKESFLVNDVEQGNRVSAADKRILKLGPIAKERVSNGIFHSREILEGVDLPAHDSLPPREGQEFEKKTESVFAKTELSLHVGVPPLDSSTEPNMLESVEIDERAYHENGEMPGESENNYEESCPKVENTQLDIESEVAFNEIPVLSADLSVDVRDADKIFTPGLVLKVNSGHAVMKKTKGFNRLVKFEKSSGLEDASDNKVNPIKRFHDNDTCFFDDKKSPEKQYKVSEGVDTDSVVPKDSMPGIGADDCASSDYERANQSESKEFPCKEECTENSRSSLRGLMDDLLSISLDPFYGIERDCPSKVLEAFTKFRSLVYKKSLRPKLSLGSSKSFMSSCEIEDDQDTKTKFGVKESETLLPLSISKGLNVEDVVDDGNADSEPNEITPRKSSRIEHSSQDIKTSRSQAAEVKENGKRKMTIKPDGSNSLKRLRKLKDLDFIPSKTSDSRPSIRKLAGPSKGDLQESAQQLKESQKSCFVRLSNSSKTLEEPMALCMKFPPDFALPSEVQLKVRFTRFGPLDVSGTRIYCNSGSAQVVFKHHSDAEAAYKYAIENNLFGQAKVSFWLKQIFQPKKKTPVTESGSELTKLSKVRNDNVPSSVSGTVQEDSVPLRSLDKQRNAEVVAEDTAKTILQLQPVVQLKSCLKKPDDSGNDSLKETARVKFLLESKGPSAAAQIAMEEHSKIENVNIPAITSFPLENKTIVNIPIKNNPMEPDPPDISHQMMYLLMKCNDIVTDISRSLGYIPYCPL